MNTATTSRRQVLLGLAAASTAAATVTEASASENPELVELGNQLPAIEAEYVSARRAAAQIYRDAMKNWPLAPEEIVRFRRASLCGELERDVAGTGLHRQGEGDVWCIWTVEQIEATIAEYERDVARILKTKRQNRLGWHVERLNEARKALPKARAYWRKCARIRKSCGYETASKRKHEAMDSLRDHVNAIMEAEERTMLGVVIKAQALQSWTKVETFYRSLNSRGIDWPNQMSAAIIRQAGGAA